MEIELLKEYPDGYCTIKKMRDIGTKGNIQSQRTAPKKLVEYLDKKTKNYPYCFTCNV